MRNIYFKLINETEKNNRFEKHAWKLEGEHENSNILLIQYTGDETIYKGHPHGNNKQNKTAFVRTKPSLFKKNKDKEPMCNKWN